MASRSLSEKNKRLFLAAVGLLLAVTVIYQFFFNKPASRPKQNARPGDTAGTPPSQPQASAPATPQVRRLGAAAQEDARIQELLSDLRPLNVSLTTDRSSSTPGSRGSIFAYYVPPPPPPPKAPDPPPIQLVGLQPQTAVAGTPRGFTMVVTGSKMPDDAQVLIDGAPRPTKRIGETQLSIDIVPGDYSFVRNMNIEVKSKGNPGGDYSNSITFVVQPAPEPQFAYKGRLGTLGEPQNNYAVFEMTGTREIKRAKVGDTVMGIWRIDVISADAVEITHKQYEIKRRVPLQDKVR